MNSGKQFEQNWKKSIPEKTFYYRLKDSSNTWANGGKTRFTPSNICDCIIFMNNHLYTLELKSTKGKTLPFKNIKRHQIDDLIWADSYKNIISGFVIEFADIGECYFIEINLFKEFYDNTDRKSLPIDYCRLNGLKIDSKKLKTNYRFDVESFLKESVIYYG